MAEGNGIFITKGRVGNIVFYMLDGKQVVRTIGKVSKNRRKTGKSYARVRENNAEFGTASKIGKVLRNGFSPFDKKCGDIIIPGRLVAWIKELISVGSGERGKRSFEVSRHKDMLKGFEFNKAHKFGELFSAVFSAPELDVATGNLTWNVPEFNSAHCVAKTKGATHFKLVLASTVLSDYVWDAEQKMYVVAVKTNSSMCSVVYSAELPIGGMVSVVLRSELVLPDGVAGYVVVVAVGIEFYQEVNGEFYELGKTVMRIEGAV